ncbi:RDD family protein [Rhodocytophaga aerolata]|uniref:RDD family protein n=1 Tax=Rhodocytophaga aerolata TaxID=455078 RepID=A0ABT8RAQ9_9BACT|nr:RDD family protein [Rhodocytophaga aerolata]MDO1449089.1 RDD family protein [Rhodocytophaga aerolata]
MQQISTDGLLNKQELLKDIIRPTRRRKRFFNSLLDGIFFSLFFYALVMIIVLGYGVISFLTGNDSSQMIGEEAGMMIYLIYYIGYLTYFITFEHYFGKTLGKMVTNTRVVLMDGSQPKLIKLIMRSFARLIPLDFLSYLSKDPRGWHDTISDTMVIDDIPLYRVGPKAISQEKEEEVF